MPDSTISTPRLDRKFVDAQGNLTQNAYALLFGLITRTGGVQAVVIDANGMQEQIDDALVAARTPPLVPEDPLLPPAHIPVPEQQDDGRLQSLEAEVGRLRDLVAGLQQGPQA